MFVTYRCELAATGVPDNGAASEPSLSDLPVMMSVDNATPGMTSWTCCTRASYASRV